MDARRRHELLQELLLAARELSPQEREAFLGAACVGEESLRREIDQLLAHDEEPVAVVEAWSAEAEGSPALRVQLEKLLNTGAVEREQDETSDATQITPRSIGDFRILRKLGEGGMGIVYEAEQNQPRRIVALKVLRSVLLSPEALRRFEHECELLGRLQHPGIAQVFASGRAATEHGDLPYLAMERISGLPLTEYADRRALSLRDRLELFARVTDAVQHAHLKGVIHRDLKPANILVDDAGVPKILDFGIARAIDADLRLSTMHTGTGQLLGTLAYMSPEQAAGESRAIDTRSDVYALGVLLYEFLARRLPYDVSQKSLAGAVQVIREVTPYRISFISTALRGDIETIVGKALEKERGRRYASAEDLGADIRRVLHNQPIYARPPSPLYLLKKVVQRHRTFFAALAAVFVVLVAGLVVSLHFAFAEAEQRRTAEREAYRANLTATVQAIRAGNLTAARAAHTRAGEHLNAWEWQHLDRTWVQELARITIPDLFEAAYLDEWRILTVSDASVLRVWDALKGELTTLPATWTSGKRALALTTGGRWLLAHADGALYLGDPQASVPLRVLPFSSHTPKARTRCAAVSQGGARMAVVTESEELFLVDGATGEQKQLEVLEPEGFDQKVLALSFSTAGDLLAVRYESATILWDAEQARGMRRSNGPIDIAIAPEGTMFAEESTTRNGSGAGIYFKESRTGKALRFLPRTAYGSYHFAPCAALHYSPDQHLLAVAFTTGEIHLVNADAALPLPLVVPAQFSIGSLGTVAHGSQLGLRELALTFSPEGSTWMSLRSSDHSLRIWSVGASGPKLDLGDQTSKVQALAFSPDGATIALSRGRETIHLWDAALDQEILAFPIPSAGRCIAFDPGGRQLACGMTEGLVVFDLRTGGILAWPTRTAIQAVAFSPDGSVLAAAAVDHRTFVWNATSFEELCVLEQPPGSQMRSLAFNADGTLLATGSQNAELSLWNPHSGSLVAQAQVREHKGASQLAGARSIAFSPDGARLLIGWGDSALTEVDVPSLKQRSLMQDHVGEVFAVAYSPDGTRIASGGRDGLLRLWRADTGRLLVQLEGHSESISALAFSPDGKKIATGSSSENLRIWNSEPMRSSWASQCAVAEALPAAEQLVTALELELGDLAAVCAHIEADPALSPVLRRFALLAILRREVARAASGVGR